MQYTKDKIVQAVTINRELKQLLESEPMTPAMIDLIQQLVVSHQELGRVIASSVTKFKQSLT